MTYRYGGSWLQERILAIFLSVCVILPTGSILGLNAKFLSLFILIAALVLNARNGVLYRLAKSLWLPIFCLLLFSILTLVGQGYSQEFFQHCKDFIVFFFIVALGHTVVCSEERGQYFIDIIIRCLLFIGLVKAGILLYSISTGNSIALIVKGISEFFGTTLMTMESDDVAISRINFMSDYILPPAIFVIVRRIILSRSTLKNSFFLSILLLSILISLSRFLWVIGAASILLALASEIKKYKSFSIVAIFLSLTIYWLGLESTQELLEFRFFTKETVASDQTRLIQLGEIMTHFEMSPIFGNGLGYYISTFIRSEAAKYSYELQIPALLMQVGIIGVTLLFMFLIFPLWRAASRLKYSQRFAYYMLILAWLAGGFFNPVIVSSTGGIAYLFIYSIPFYIGRRSDLLA